MNEQSAREYSESLGQIFDGGYRQAAWADKEKIPQSLGMTMRDWVYEYLGGYVRMSVEQRDEAILELANEGTPAASIARSLGVSNNTVADVVKGKDPAERWKKLNAARNAEVEPEETLRNAQVEPDQLVDLSAMQKGANEAARNDPLAALYGATKALSWLKATWTPEAVNELEPEERRRLDGDLEAYALLLRKIQSSLMAEAV